MASRCAESHFVGWRGVALRRVALWFVALRGVVWRCVTLCCPALPGIAARCVTTRRVALYCYLTRWCISGGATCLTLLVSRRLSSKVSNTSANSDDPWRYTQRIKQTKAVLDNVTSSSRQVAPPNVSPGAAHSPWRGSAYRAQGAQRWQGQQR